jgi:hypothetical protein
MDKDTLEHFAEGDNRDFPFLQKRGFSRGGGDVVILPESCLSVLSYGSSSMEKSSRRRRCFFLSLGFQCCCVSAILARFFLHSGQRLGISNPFARRRFLSASEKTKVLSH